MKLSKVAGATSEIWQVFIRDSSSTTGGGLTGLVFNTASLTAYYHRDTDTTATAITLATMTVGTFTSGGFKEIDATNMPGWYQFCPPNAAIASGAKSCSFHLKGATNMAPTPIEVQLTTFNPDTAPLTAAQIATGVWTDTTAGDFTTALSVGKSVMNGVTLGTGLTIARCTLVDTVTTVTNQLTAAAIATGVWQDTTAGDFTVASSIGKCLYISNVVPGGAGGHFIAGTNAATSITTGLTAHIIGTVDTVTNVTNGVNANLVQIDGVANASATFAIKKFYVVNDDGNNPAVKFMQTAGSGNSCAWLIDSTINDAVIFSCVASLGAGLRLVGDTGLELEGAVKDLSLVNGLWYIGGSYTPTSNDLASAYFRRAVALVSGGLVVSTTGTTTTLDTGALAVANLYVGQRLRIVSGLGNGQSEPILGYTSGRVASHAAWVTNPNASSRYVIEPGKVIATDASGAALSSTNIASVANSLAAMIAANKFTAPALSNAPSGGSGGPVGSGANSCTMTITDSGTALAIPDADVWISSDAAGTAVIAGTLQTNSQGKVTFLLDAGTTVYLWMQKDGEQSIRGQSFVVVAD